MKIERIEARWIQCPIPEEKQHVSDFGRMTSFDMALVTVTTRSGLQGFGEAKGAVGSSGECAALVSCVEKELAPRVVGSDAREITRAFETLYNGPRAHYALERGRGFPVLGRRGLTIAAVGAIDMALWDLLGKHLDVPIVQLLGGRCRDKMKAYASGGWAGPDEIGEQLRGYVEKGFQAVKMRVGVMDGTVERSILRVRNARKELGPKIDIMVDAHGTFSVPEAKRFARGVEDCALRWFEEPINSDQRERLSEVRAVTSIPIAMGESEFTRFDIQELIRLQAVDVLQPDAAIIGGLTESHRIAQLAHTHQLELAPHLWGSAFSFMAGVHLAFASPSAVILEFSLGGNPLLHEMVEETISAPEGLISSPEKPGLGVTPRQEFIDEYTVPA